MGKADWESEARFRCVFDHAAVPMALATLEARFVMVNQAALRFIGYTEEELYRLTIRDITHPEDRPLMEAAMARKLPRLLAGEISNYQVERRYIRKDGEVVWGRSTISAVRDEQNRPSHLVGVVEDVTELKRAEAAMRMSEERFRATFEQAGVGMAEIGLDGRWLRVNQRLCAIVGYDSHELLGRTCREIAHPDDVPEAVANTHRLLAGEIDRFAMERRYIRKDGELVWVNLTVSLVRDHLGKPAYFIAANEDITRRKKAEEEMRRAGEEARRAQAAAEAANKSKDQFLAALSHELRTPLTPALATVSLLESDPTLSPSAREDIEMVRRNIETEARLIDDLLDLTRIARGKVQLRFEAVDVRAVLRSALEICRSQIELKRLELSLALRSRHHYVWADSGRLEQVFLNLLQNAIKFTAAKGRIAVRTQELSDSRLCVEVSDTGVGIEPDRLGSIFDAFEQGERTVTRDFGGLGLGLTIAKSLVDMHGGAISAASEGRGKGATFAVELPLIATEAPVVEAALPMPTPAGGRVLLVEDHPDTLHVMSRLLKGMGFSVVTASTVHEALQAARREKVDLLVSDIGLPDGSGTEVMRELLQDRGLVKGVAISGFGMEEDVRRSREAGFTEHLTKPVHVQVLADALRRIGSSEPESVRGS